MDVNRDELLIFFDIFVKDMREIMEKKNHDSSGVGDVFKNFRMVEDLGVTTTEIVLFTRWLDMVSRLGTLITTNESAVDESIIDTLSDLANYSILLAAYLKFKNKVCNTNA